jgi:hypothetical protein
MGAMKLLIGVVFIVAGVALTSALAIPLHLPNMGFGLAGWISLTFFLVIAGIALLKNA